MQFEQLRRFERDQILGAFGMPLPIMGITESVNRSNAEAAEVMYARWMIRPRLTRIRAALNEKLVKLYPDGDSLHFDFVDPVPENRVELTSEGVLGYEKQVLTLNEARRRFGEDDWEGPEGNERMTPSAPASPDLLSLPEEIDVGDADDLLDEEDDVEEDIDLEEVLKALSEEDEMSDEEEEVEEVAKLKTEIKEHRDVVKYLRAKLNEVNLLNAKLLFSNKLFRVFGLSNEQKMKVVETFDRTKNIREIKLVYSTLAESFKGNKPLKESKGSSSKAVASTKPVSKKVISEGTDLKNRFQKLANIL